MKTRIMIPTACLVLFFACKSSPEAQNNFLPAERAGKNKEMAADTRKMPVPVERKMSIRYDDGALDEYTLSEYNDRGYISKKTRYSASVLLLGSIEYEYEAELLVKKTEKDATGGILSETVYEYAEGLLAKELLYTGEGQLLSGILYTYNQDALRLSQTVVGKDDRVLAKTLYDWEGPQLLKTRLLDPVGGLVAYSLFRYDKNGNVSRQDYYNSEDLLLRSELHSYEGDKMLGTIRLDSKGDTLISYAYEYGEFGEIQKKKVNNSITDTKYSLNYEYSFRE